MSGIALTNIAIVNDGSLFFRRAFGACISEAFYEFFLERKGELLMVVEKPGASRAYRSNRQKEDGFF